MDSNRRTKARTGSMNLLDYQVVDEIGQTGGYAMGRTLNISEDGMLLETHVPLELGQLVLITLDLADNLIQITGKVMHTSSSEEERHRAGVKFFHVEAEERRIINEYIRIFNETNLPPAKEPAA